MAAFCTKCGSPLPSSTGFCPSCGTAVGAGVVSPGPEFTAVPVAPLQPVQAPPAAAPPAAAYAPVAAYPAAQPATSSGGALKIILIVIAVVVGLGLLAGGVVMYGVYKVAHTVTTDSKGNATISALGANISAGKNVTVSAAELGVPLYPGAQSGEGGMHMTLPTMSMVQAVYTTSDPVSAVVAFYKGKLGENESDIDTDTGSIMSASKDGPTGKDGTVITIGAGSGNNNGKTQISITHTVSTK
jgi:hypothetical protein